MARVRYILQLSLVKFSVSLTFFGMGQDGHTHTDGQTNGQTDFNQKILLEIFLKKPVLYHEI